MPGELERRQPRKPVIRQAANSVRTWVSSRVVAVHSTLDNISTKTWSGLAILTVGTGVAIAEDFLSDVWVDRPMLATLAGGVLVLGWTVVFVNQYLAARERRRWLTVAAAALEDLGRVARNAWFQIVVNLHLVVTVNPQVAVTRAQMMTTAGRTQLAAATLALARTPDGPSAIFKELHKVAEVAREVLAMWTPIMITQPGEAKRLSDFADLHRRVVQLLTFLQRKVLANMPLAITDEEVADKPEKIIDLALQQDQDLFRAADQMAALWDSR